MAGKALAEVMSFSVLAVVFGILMVKNLQKRVFPVAAGFGFGVVLCIIIISVAATNHVVNGL